jgi:hypothetical protein
LFIRQHFNDEPVFDIDCEANEPAKTQRQEPSATTTLARQPPPLAAPRTILGPLTIRNVAILAGLAAPFLVLLVIAVGMIGKARRRVPDADETTASSSGSLTTGTQNGKADEREANPTTATSETQPVSQPDKSKHVEPPKVVESSNIKSSDRPNNLGTPPQMQIKDSENQEPFAGPPPSERNQLADRLRHDFDDLDDMAKVTHAFKTLEAFEDDVQLSRLAGDSVAALATPADAAKAMGFACRWRDAARVERSGPLREMLLKGELFWYRQLSNGQDNKAARQAAKGSETKAGNVPADEM